MQFKDSSSNCIFRKPNAGLHSLPCTPLHDKTLPRHCLCPAILIYGRSLQSHSSATLATQTHDPDRSQTLLLNSEQ